MAATMPSLDGIADEWESSSELRKVVRANKTSLLSQHPFDDCVKISVACAEINFAILAPLAKRLRDSSGAVGMHNVPHLEKQWLVPIKMVLLARVFLLS